LRQDAAGYPADLPPHRCAIRGHIFCTFLALVLRKELMDRLAARDLALPEWQHIVDDLLDLSEIEVEQDGRRRCCAPPRGLPSTRSAAPPV